MRIAYRIKPEFPSGPGTFTDIRLDGLMDATTVQDRSIYGNHLTITRDNPAGAMPQHPGFNIIRDIKGTEDSVDDTFDQLVRATSDLPTAYPLSMSCWAKMNLFDPWLHEQLCFTISENSSNDQFTGMGYEADVADAFYMRSAGSGERAREVSTGVSGDDGKWHHLLAVHNNSASHVFYENAVLIGELTFDEDMYSAGPLTHLSIGCRVRDAGSTPVIANGYSGDVSDCLLFDRALTVPEIKSIYSLQRHKFSI